MPAPSPIQLLDTVALLTDVSELGLLAGEVGAVVELLSDDAFEVEFCGEPGHTYGLHTLRAHQIDGSTRKGIRCERASKRRRHARPYTVVAKAEATRAGSLFFRY